MRHVESLEVGIVFSIRAFNVVVLRAILVVHGGLVCGSKTHSEARGLACDAGPVSSEWRICASGVGDYNGDMLVRFPQFLVPCKQNAWMCYLEHEHGGDRDGYCCCGACGYISWTTAGYDHGLEVSA